MNIGKLTITPILKGNGSVIYKNVNNKIASTLIKEKINMEICYNREKPKALRRLPKALRGWVNPDSHV